MTCRGLPFDPRLLTHIDTGIQRVTRENRLFVFNPTADSSSNCVGQRSHLMQDCFPSVNWMEKSARHEGQASGVSTRHVDTCRLAVAPCGMISVGPLRQRRIDLPHV